MNKILVYEFNNCPTVSRNNFLRKMYVCYSRINKKRNRKKIDFDGSSSLSFDVRFAQFCRRQLLGIRRKRIMKTKQNKKCQ